MLNLLVSNREGTLAGARSFYLVEKNSLVAGSSPGVDLLLEDSSIAARHFELFEKEGVLYLRDLSLDQGGGGTSLNGVMLDRQHPVPFREGDVVEAGVFCITLSCGTQARQGSCPEPQYSAQLELIGAVGERYTLPPFKSVWLGRSTLSDIVIADNAVSRRHAQIFVTGGKYYLRDEGSTNGSFVNGKRVRRPRCLRDGDRITLGNTSFRFLYPRGKASFLSLRPDVKVEWLLPAAGLLGLMGTILLIMSVLR